MSAKAIDVGVLMIMAREICSLPRVALGSVKSGLRSGSPTTVITPLLDQCGQTRPRSRYTERANESRTCV